MRERTTELLESVVRERVGCLFVFFFLLRFVAFHEKKHNFLNKKLISYIFHTFNKKMFVHIGKVRPVPTSGYDTW